MALPVVLIIASAHGISYITLFSTRVAEEKVSPRVRGTYGIRYLEITIPDFTVESPTGSDVGVITLS